MGDVHLLLKLCTEQCHMVWKKNQTSLFFWPTQPRHWSFDVWHGVMLYYCCHQHWKVEGAHSSIWSSQEITTICTCPEQTCGPIVLKIFVGIGVRLKTSFQLQWPFVNKVLKVAMLLEKMTAAWQLMELMKQSVWIYFQPVLIIG